MEGSVCLANTQPFVRELGGRAHVFAHNGQLGTIAQTPSSNLRHFAPVGETDSEVAFCILLERLSRLWQGTEIPSLAARHAEVLRFASEMRDHGPANFLYCDSDTLFAHGHRRIQSGGKIAPPGLWLLQRSCSSDDDATIVNEMSQQDQSVSRELTLIASVPLSDEDWRPFAEGEIAVVQNGNVVLV
jgi:glutamine amidotransferase